MKHSRLGLFLVFSLFGCTNEPTKAPLTQVLLRVDASDELRMAAEHLRVRVAVQAAESATWQERPSVTLRSEDYADGRPFWPVDIPITPRDPEHLPSSIEVVVEALDGEDAASARVLAQERVVTGFVGRSLRVLSVALAACSGKPLGELCEQDDSCHGRECLRCDNGSCVSTKLTKPGDLPTTPPRSQLPMDAGPVSMADAGPEERGAGASGAGGAGGAAGSRAEHGGGGGAADSGNGGAAGSDEKLHEVWSSPARVDTGNESVALVASANNPSADVVVAYWQSFVHVRRFVSGRWDTEPVALNGLQPMLTTDRRAVALGIDNSDVAQFLYTDGERKTRWVRWNGQSTVHEAPEPNAFGDQVVAEDLAISVTETGLATAVWSAPENAGKRALYANWLTVKGWQRDPMLLGSVNELKAFQVAENGSGDFLLLAAARVDSSDALFLESFVGRGQTTQHLDRLPLPAAEPVAGLLAALDHRGNALALLALQKDESWTLSFTSRKADAMGWSPLESLEHGSVGLAAVTLRGDGVGAAWFVRDAPTSEQGHIVARGFDADSGWGAAIDISGDIAIDKQGGLALAGNAAGELIAFWSQVGTEQRLTYARFESGKWTAPSVIASSPFAAQPVSVALAPDGRALALWTQTNGDGVTNLMWSRSK